MEESNKRQRTEKKDDDGEKEIYHQLVIIYANGQPCDLADAIEYNYFGPVKKTIVECVEAFKQVHGNHDYFDGYDKKFEPKDYKELAQWLEDFADYRELSVNYACITHEI